MSENLKIDNLFVITEILLEALPETVFFLSSIIYPGTGIDHRKIDRNND